MKVFQVLNGFCHYDATPFVNSIEHAKEIHSPEINFVEAPDFVFEGWGFDENAEGDDRFIRPTAPVGYIYDEKSGVFILNEGDEEV